MKTTVVILTMAVAYLTIVAYYQDQAIGILHRRIISQNVAVMCVNWYFNNPSTSLVDAKKLICGVK